MNKTEVLIIGGGIAGTTAAETFRAKDSTTKITIVSSEKHPLYSRVLLPHAIKEKMGLLKVYLKQDNFYSENNIEYLSGVTIVNMDPSKKEVYLDDGESLQYEKLVIATGGSPTVWDLKGSDLNGVLRLQTIDDAREIGDSMKNGGRLVIIGTGFIALEFASIALHFGLEATIINRGDHFCSSLFGPKVGEVVREILAEKGVDILDNSEVIEVLGETEVEGVRTNDEKVIECTHVGVGIGLDLNIEPFNKIGVNKGILANEYLETNSENIWVAGDCAEFDDALLGLKHVIGNWTNAMAQGRHVGQALLGERKKYEVLTSYTSKCFPGINTIFIGETRSRGKFKRVERVIEEGKRVIEFHLFRNRLIGAILLNVPEERNTIVKLINSKKNMFWKSGKLSDPKYPLATLNEVS